MRVAYTEGNIVVFRNDDKYNVGIVTNVRKKKNQVLGYDVRSEKGGCYTLVQVDKEKSKYSIDIQPMYSKGWIEYMTKCSSKSDIKDSVDWDNLYLPPPG